MEQGPRIRNPIVILTTPRSGSSMTAGLFAQHGVWVGPSKGGDKFNARGYFESEPFKRALIGRAGRLTHKGELAEKPEGWRAEALALIEANGYTGGPWLVKHSAMYYPVWHEFDPKFICVRRDVGAIARSGKRSGYLNSPEAIGPHIEALDYVRDNMGGVDVFTDELIAGDYSSIERAFGHCGLTFNPAIADDFIDPTLWHF